VWIKGSNSILDGEKSSQTIHQGRFTDGFGFFDRQLVAVPAKRVYFYSFRSGVDIRNFLGGEGIGLQVAFIIIDDFFHGHPAEALNQTAFYLATINLFAE